MRNRSFLLMLAVTASVAAVHIPAYAQWPKIMPPSGTEPIPDGPEVGSGPPELWWLLTTPPNGFVIHRPERSTVIYFAHVFKRGTVVRKVVRNYPRKERFLTTGPDAESYVTTAPVFLVFRFDTPRDDPGLSRSPTKGDLLRWYEASDYMVTVADESPPNAWFSDGDETKYLEELWEVLLPALHKSQETPPSEAPSPKPSPAPGPRRARFNS